MQEAAFGELKAEVKVCESCGWWCKNRRSSRRPYPDEGKYYSMWGACAQLKALDLIDISVPLEEIKQYLIAKYQDRFNLHPKIFEDVVGNVFRSQGFETIVTAYQKDGGIDAVLTKGDSQTVGVQVKRYRGKIDVEQIRAFAGALILEGHTSGIFVTTSSYSSVAQEAARSFGVKGIPIELIDSETFYEALRLSKREPFSDMEDFYYEMQGIDEQVIYEDEGPF
jgi:restriction system protein